MKESTKLIAFYLPQFHPIPENDLWWGKEFTEWTNVKKAKPNFDGHYQPRYPGELGYYDLRDIDVQKKQIALAKEFGIYGFCYYYYWFSGKRLLERPLNQFLENKELDFPFCICWANENWTRRWDGLENEILIAQNHAPEDYHNFIRDVAPLLADARYIRIGGKPLLIVYRVSLLPNPSQAAEVWRKECLRLGIGEIYLAAAQSFGIQDPRPYGFDAALEFPPHVIPPIYVDKSTLSHINPDFSGIIQDYRITAALKMLETPTGYIKFRTIIPGWDNTARKQNNSGIFANSSPAIYKKWLKEAVEYTKKNLPSDQQFIFINAWNEWAEGAYLEPDKRYGRDYLQATKEALELNPKNEKIIQTPEEKIEDLNYIIKTLYESFSGLREHAIARDTQLVERDTQLVKRDTQLVECNAQLVERDTQLAERNAQLAERDTQLAECNAQLVERDTQLAERNAQLVERDTQLAERNVQLVERDTQLVNIQASKAWKLMIWLRRLRLLVAPPQSIQAKIARIILKVIKKIVKIR